MTYRFLSAALLSTGLSLGLMGCSKSGVDGEPVDSKLGVVSCSLQGTWERCTDNGGTSSTMVRLHVNGSDLSETIEDFNSNADCSGAADSQFPINAVVTLGAIGESTSIAGGTDVDLVPDMDFGGCGLGQPMYTVMKFDDACTQFQISNTGPSCSSSSRGTDVDPAAFMKK